VTTDSRMSADRATKLRSANLRTGAILATISYPMLINATWHSGKHLGDWQIALQLGGFALLFVMCWSTFIWELHKLRQ